MCDVKGTFREMIEKIIQNCTGSSDDYITGFADMEGLIAGSSLRYGIVIGRQLDNRIVDAIAGGPTLEYLNHYRAMNSELSALIHNIGNQISGMGYTCRIIEPTINDSDITDKYYNTTLRTPVSHKMIATRAGLGWIGKTDLFISKRFGPRLRLVSLLTDYPLPVSGSPVEKSRCGNCDKCVVSCPAGAATGSLWDIHTDRDYFFNPHKCRDKCRELAKTILNSDLSVCGICVSVCPVGKLN